jgi:F5/8 type C domain
MKKIFLAGLLMGLLMIGISGSAYAAPVQSICFVSSSPITGSTNGQVGYSYYQGTYAAFTNPQNIALGATVMVSETIPGFPTIHNATFLTDGNYGNGRSWIGDGSNSWLTINLGSIQSFDTLSFGRDRRSYYDDRDPGQFTISISDDNSLFTQIFDSKTFNFSGFLGAGQTVQANLSKVRAQYVRLQLADVGAAVDEVEIQNSISSVPLPTALWLFGSGLVGLFGTRIKRKKA